MRHFRYCSTLSSVDMVTLAKRDGAFHITEKMFIKQVGRLLGFSDNDIDEIIATTG